MDIKSFYSKNLTKFKTSKNSGWVQSGLCPFHKDSKTGNFSVNLTNGAFKCFSCGEKGGGLVTFLAKKNNQSYKEARKELGIENVSRLRANTYNVNDEKDLEDSSNKINTKAYSFIEKILKESKPINDISSKLVLNYFKKRGLSKISEDMPQDLYFHPNLLYYENNKNEYYPALVAVIRDSSNSIVALHRTYLNTESVKASVSSPKKITTPIYEGALNSAAIKLFPLEGRKQIGICEGIETALAVREITGLTIWSVISSTFMERFTPPKGVNRVHIFADYDISGAGELAAKKLAQRLENKNINCVIYLPEQKEELQYGKDWLDVLNEKIT